MLKVRETFIVFTELNLIKNGAKTDTFAQHILKVCMLRSALLLAVRFFKMYSQFSNVN